MTHEQQRHESEAFFLKAQAKFFEEGLSLIVLKGADYAPERIAMTEVFFTAADITTSPEQVLWVHVRKHLSAIANHMAGVTLRSEDIRERLTDVANYMALIDSYIKNPVIWLNHLGILIMTGKFPNRSRDEMDRLITWYNMQRALNKMGDPITLT